MRTQKYAHAQRMCTTRLSAIPTYVRETMKKFPCEVVLIVTLVAVHGSSGFTSTDQQDKCQRNVPRLTTNFSTTSPVSPLHGNVVMYCVVEFHNSSATSSAVATCARSPERNTEDPHANCACTHHLSGNRFNITLSINNVTKADEADYTLSVEYFGNCSYPCPQIHLEVDECLGRVLQPVNCSNVTIVSSVNTPSLRLAGIFEGDEANNEVMWSNSNTLDLKREGARGKYVIGYKFLSPCTFSEELVIHNLSMSDSGIYTASVLDHSDSVKYFEVILVDSEQGHSPRNSLLSLLAVGVIIALIIALGVGISAYVYRKRKCRHRRDIYRLEENPGGNGASDAVQLLNASGKTKKNIALLYCSEGMDLKELDYLVLLLDYCHDIETYVNFKVGPQYDWSVWMQQRMAECSYTVVICTRQLCTALERVNEGSMVQIRQAQLNACSIVSSVREQLSRVVLVFINGSRDKRIIPLPEMLDKPYFNLDVSSLMDATWSDSESKYDGELIYHAINCNPKFKHFRNFIQHLIK